MAAMYRKLGLHEHALEYDKRSLELRQALFPGSHEDIAHSLNSVGRAYEALGQHE